MAKRGNSVIGIDLGKRAYKAVLLNKKSETRYALTSFASHEVPEEVTTADDVAQHIKQLLKDLGGYTKSCALAVSEPSGTFWRCCVSHWCSASAIGLVFSSRIAWRSSAPSSRTSRSTS